MYNAKNNSACSVTELPFCQEASIKDQFAKYDTKNMLQFNASYKAIGSAFAFLRPDNKRCKCYMTTSEHVDVLYIGMLFTEHGLINRCSKTVDVIHEGERLVSFGCETEAFELHDIGAGTTTELVLSPRTNFTLMKEEDDTLVLHLAPGKNN